MFYNINIMTVTKYTTNTNIGNYCYKNVNIYSGYNISNGNYTSPVLAQGTDTLPAANNFIGFPPVQQYLNTDYTINAAQGGGGTIGYQINGVDLLNNASNKCTAYSKFYGTSTPLTISIPSWANTIGFLLCGGGGGGGGGASIDGNEQYGCGGSGGGGGAVIVGYIMQPPSSSFNLTIGSGGPQGTSPTVNSGGNSPGNAGTAGNATTLTFSNNITFIAGGGQGGGGGQEGNGGGSPSTPGYGGNANVYGNIAKGIGGFNSTANAGGKAPAGTSGAASSSNIVNNYSINPYPQTFPIYISSGGVPSSGASNSTPNPGQSGNGYGAGGGGGGSVNGKANGSEGGQGTNGMAQIWFYI